MKRGNTSEGFTLVEVLVAFIVVAVLMIAVQRAALTSVAGAARADIRIRSEMVARTLMTGPLGLGPDAITPKSGRMNGLNWSLRFQPIKLPFSPTPAPRDKALWTPMRMIISVSNETPPASNLTVEVVRLVNLAAP